MEEKFSTRGSTSRTNSLMEDEEKAEQREAEAEDVRAALADLEVMEHAAVLLERMRACQKAYSR